MAVGLPPVNAELLRQVPWLMTGLGLSIGFFQSVLMPEPARWWFLCLSLVGGALLGVYGRYRARFAVSQGIVVSVLLLWFFASLCAGPAGLAVSALGVRYLALPASLTVTAYFALLATLGWWRGEQRWRAASAAGLWERRISEFVDVNNRLLSLQQHALPPPSRTVPIWTAVGVNLPMVAVALGGENSQVLVLIAALMFLLPMFGWIVMRYMPDFALYLNLRRYERQHGFRFESDQREALAQVRSTFRLRNWLCRPEDRVAPAPMKRRGRRPRGRR